MDLFEQLKAVCWDYCLYTFEEPSPNILPQEVQAICDSIKESGELVPNGLLDMSEFIDYPDRYPQKYGIGYYEIMSWAIDDINDYYEEIANSQCQYRGGG